MDLPTIQRLTPPIRESIHIGECQLIPYSGSIADRICVLGGGGDKSLVATAFGELPMQTGAKSLTTLIRLAVVLVPLLVAALFWAFYRYQVSSAAKGVTAAQSSASPSKSQQTAPIDERLSNAERAIMFSIAPLTVAARGDDADRSRSGRELPPAHCVASRCCA